MLWALICPCCFGKAKRKAVLSLEEVVLAMEQLPREDLKRLLKRYIKTRSQEAVDRHECCWVGTPSRRQS